MARESPPPETALPAIVANGISSNGIRCGHAIGESTIAAATHFFPLNGTDRRVTDYYAGVECDALRPRLWGAPGHILLRYGLTTGERTGPEHGGGLGLALADRFRLDASLVRERGYADAAWRPTVGVRFRVGRYAIAAARATGLNGIGASYRVGLDADLRQ